MNRFLSRAVQRQSTGCGHHASAEAGPTPLSVNIWLRHWALDNTLTREVTAETRTIFSDLRRN